MFVQILKLFYLCLELKMKQRKELLSVNSEFLILILRKRSEEIGRDHFGSASQKVLEEWHQMESSASCVLSSMCMCSAHCAVQGTVHFESAVRSGWEEEEPNMGILTLAPNMAHTRIRHTNQCNSALVHYTTRQTFLPWW